MIDSDGNIYFIPVETPQYLYSIKADGSIRWKYLLLFNGSTENSVIPTIDYDGNIYIIGLDTTSHIFYPMLLSVDYDGNFRWKYIFSDVEDEDFSQPLICDAEGTVYVGSTVGYYYYAISSNGVLRWKLPLIFIYQQVDNTGAIGKDGTLYLGVHAISLLTGQERTLIAITLKVYDMLGKEVAVLVNGNKPAGYYTVEFNGSNLTSGVYIYRLTAGNFSSAKKLMLMK